MGTLHDRCGEKMRRIIELAAIDSPSERFCFEQRAEHRSICRGRIGSSEWRVA